MLYYDFCGYEVFKARFGLEKRDNGTVARKNKIGRASCRERV